MERKTSNTSWRLALAVALAMSLVAASGAAAAPKRDTVVIASANEPPTLDPTNQTSLMTKEMCMLMYNRLFTIDAKLNVVPDLVDSYTTPSPTVWLMKIKAGVKFHNGHVLSSADVKATLEYCAASSYASAYVTDIKKIEIVDGLTVRITTAQPCPLLPMNLSQSSVSIIPKDMIDSKHNFNAEPCGTGPYKFKRWVLGDKVEFVRNADYFDTKRQPSIQNLVWKVIPEGSSRTIALQAGEVDFLYDVATIDLPTLQNDKGVTVLLKESCNLNYLTFNVEKKPFDNALVRKAIDAAIDKQGIVTEEGSTPDSLRYFLARARS